MNKSIHIWAPSFNNFGGGIGRFIEEVIFSLKHNKNFKVLKFFAKVDQYSSYSGNEIHKAIGKSNLIKNLSYASIIITHAIRNHPSLIMCMHVNFSPCALLLKYFFNIPYVVCVYGIDVDSNLSYFRKMSLKRADSVITISNWTKKKVILHGVQKENIVIVGLTASKDKFIIDKKNNNYFKKYNIKKKAKIILTVSRLSSDEKYKGYDRIINSLTQVIKKYQNVHYLIVGSGNDSERVQRLIAKKKLEKYVTLTGFIRDDELPSMYNFSDIYAMPSTNEGFGIVFIEALLSGIPVLGGNADGTKDALDGGKLGILVNPYDSEELINSLVLMLDDKLPTHLSDSITLRKNCIKKHSSAAFYSKVNLVVNRIITN